ncbi:serine hydrolase [Maricaulis maris]|uniref:CubicO group peptidase (Beta-lactamase class C family) n=1 Tax=Maricaulis maris TaxID=74318 RepID=A0A495DLY4_9PROT|nr:serine hydrolase [Maricaulis maris]RKR03932.1 CubicO group peptidase (beta-lactamase class C family) [Maricaulis maris]
MLKALCLATVAALATTVGASAETPEGAVASLDEFLDQFPDLGPGYAVVVVTADDVLMRRVQGVRRASTGAPMTTDTPIYIASQTKAYMGLLAARLDAEGILPLDSHLTDYWPDLQLPDGMDASQWTLRDLITHQVPIENGFITTIEAYVGYLDPADYPRLIAEHSEARETGFQYSNLGYNIYGAILATATGRSWQDWLDLYVIDPLGMDHTSARTSDFALDDLSWSHYWMGEQDGWYDIRPKTDGMMQSAGGLVTSVDDMAAWLQLQLRGEGPEGSGITAEMVSAAQTGYVATHSEDRRNAAELPCSQYSLGWNICDFEGHDFYVHGGGYTGMRTQMAFSPDLGVGVAAFSNSDNMTGWLTSRTINMYFQFLTEHETAARMRQIRIEQYPERIQRYLDYRTGNLAEVRAEERWGGWTWSPDAETLVAYTGTWSTGEPYLDLDIRIDGDQLVVHWGDRREELEPARPDRFAALSDPFDEFDQFDFERDETGALARLVWGDDTYTRIDQSGQ